MSVVIRTATPDDQNGVRYVGVLAWPATYGQICGPEYVMNGLDEYWSATAIADATASGGLIVAESAGAIVGVAHVEAVGPDLVLWKLYVVPSDQRTGVGRTLVGEVKDRARAHGGDLITEFDARNEQVRSFYTREGFEPAPPLWPGTGAVWLAWRPKS